MASITTRKGRRCTAVPKLVQIEQATPVASSSTSTSTSESSLLSSTSSTSLSSSTSTSTSTSTSISASTPSSISSSIATETQQSLPENPAERETTPTSTLPTEILPGPADTAVSASSPTPAVTDTDGVSSSALLIDTSPTPSPTPSPAQPDTQISSSADQDNGSALSTPSLFNQPVDSSSFVSAVESTALPTIATTEASSSAVETGARGTELPSTQNTQKQATGNAITTGQTVAIAAGVVGGVIAISLIAFIIWFWRKRKAQGRRSTMLTSMSPIAEYRGNEKEPYLISRRSLGPTPLPQKLWATVGAKYRRLRGRVGYIVTRSGSPSPSVNLDRGNSQFGLPEPIHSRNTSNTGPTTNNGRPVDWWSRLAEDENSNWQIRGEPENNGPAFGFRPEREMGSVQGDANGNRRRSVSVGGEQHFLGGIGLDLDSADPFSDMNVIGNNAAKTTSPVVSAVNNPFSDSNAIRAPSGVVNGGIATYVQNARHSRGHSVNVSISRQTSNASYRTSVGTVGTRRNRFRSDPFDLDRPDLLRSANSSMDATAGWASRASRSSNYTESVPSIPQQAHMRSESFTSKYSSGVSSMGWGDPGPDVGPAVERYTPSPDSRLGRRDSDAKSSKSQGSVGKAI
ncbi:uncharacterized protein F4812DRAFT_243578 [Daldinia caldariorum]|uniref:uncharacterized protein n=1 Tax=Daldinia caldariorum TaxID=326644 RepID=UPI002008DCBB|nr:uncharacterized protein F4812DRAFT_243578 [Daldinia caldariorum]KAI1463553.1 hypothetical protein F4812DRAFT_243578 [Daldinia caldariorum]